MGNLKLKFNPSEIFLKKWTKLTTTTEFRQICLSHMQIVSDAIRPSVLIMKFDEFNILFRFQTLKSLANYPTIFLSLFMCSRKIDRMAYR